MELVMITKKSCCATVVAAMACSAAMGCATQSDAFRRMSATDHENAANTLQADPDSAQAHLTAAKRLRDEERFACANVPDTDRSQGPFANPDRIETVQDRDPVFPKATATVGIAVYVRAEPGLTEQWLGREVACHLAHLAVVGHADDRGSSLSLDTVHVSVTSTPLGFRVTMTSRDRDAMHALVEKGNAIAESGSVRIARGD
jgi:hypothetical protein